MTELSSPEQTGAIALSETPEATIVMERPEELPAAMRSMTVMARAKREEARLALSDAREAKDAASAAGLNVRNFSRVLKQCRERMEFYDKVTAALEAGYCIVPNFPIDVFAVRVTGTPSAKLGTTSEAINRPPRNPGFNSQGPMALAKGEGEYVDPVPAGWIDRSTEPCKDYTGAPATRHLVATIPAGWDGLDFPFTTATARVLDATKAALVLKVFDEVGVCPERNRKRPDPMVIGRVTLGKRSGWGDRSKSLSFLIAWWLPRSALP